MADGSTGDKGAAVRRTALSACVQLMRKDGLTGAPRDRAARYFLAGAQAVAAVGGVQMWAPGEDGTYTDVLEALAAEPAPAE